MILLRDDPAVEPDTAFSFITSYDAIMGEADEKFNFPISRKPQGHNILHHRHDG